MQNTHRKIPDIPKTAAERRKARTQKRASVNSALKSFNAVEFDKAISELLGYLESTVGTDHPDYVTDKNKAYDVIQYRVIGSLSNLIQELHRVPLTNEIAKEAGFTDQTVRRHLREVIYNPLYKEELVKLQLLRSQLLATVYNLGITGNLPAAKIFLDSTNPNSCPACGTGSIFLGYGPEELTEEYV